MAEVLQGNIPPPPEPEAINTTAQGSAEPPPVEVPLAAGDVQPNAPEPLQDSAKTETDKPDASAHPDDSRADRPIRESRKCYKCGGRWALLAYFTVELHLCNGVVFRRGSHCLFFKFIFLG